VPCGRIIIDDYLEGTLSGVQSPLSSARIKTSLIFQTQDETMMEWRRYSGAIGYKSRLVEDGLQKY
jgi:hypothetical protein